MPKNNHVKEKSSRIEIDQLNKHAWELRIIDSNKSLDLSRNIIGLAEKNNYPGGKAEGLRTYGFCLIRLSRHEEAISCLQEALTSFKALDDLKGLATVYEYMGIIQRNLGKPGASLELVFKALALSQQTGFTENESTNYYQLGVTYKGLGNYEKALDHLFKSLSIARAINLSQVIGYSINVIGSIYFDTGEYDQALEYCQEGLALRRQSGDKFGEAGSLDNIGSIYIKLGDWKRAIDFCGQSLAMNDTTGDQKGRANALFNLGEIYKHQNEHKKAADFCNRSLQIRRSLADKKGEAEGLIFLLELQRTGDKREENAEHLGNAFKALQLAEEIKAIDLQGKVHWALYETYKLYENYGAALKHLELHISIEKQLHKDTITQKIANVEISHRVEEAKKEAEIFRLKNVEMAGMYEESTKQQEEIGLQKKNVEQTLAELRSMQAQLIQSEKMASLGELTAGIAHEIQNPLNFVNNFSEVSNELMDEMKEELDKEDIN